MPFASEGVGLEINLSGVVAIVGNYGSGKTEVSINLAVNRKRIGLEVCIADLDLVNPYFRTREARKWFYRRRSTCRPICRFSAP
jgi:ABC-type dipeptide/oligopeptide/nickel transport system ATPase component